MGITWINPIEITPEEDDVWVDVDLSSYITSGTTGVLLHVVRTQNAIEFGARKNGSTDNRHQPPYYQPHISYSSGVDENRIVELYIGLTTKIFVYLVGYFDDCAVFNTNATDLSLSSTEEWVDIDINVNDNAIGAIIEVRNYSTTIGRNFALRKKGSSDEHYIGTTLGNTSAFIGVDNNEILQAQISGTAIDFFLTGYVKSGMVFLTNSIDLSLGENIGAYYDLSTLPSGATGGFIEVLSSGGTYSYALRKKGSSEDIYKDITKHNWFAVECDSSRLIEGKIEDNELYFYLTAYSINDSNVVLMTLDSLLKLRVLGELIEGTAANLDSSENLTVLELIEGDITNFNSTLQLTVVELIEGEV